MSIARIRTLVALITLAGGALVAFGALHDFAACAGAYLFAFGVLSSLALGALIFAMIGTVTGARWYLPLQPYVGALAWLLVPLALLVVPVVLATHALYPWAWPTTRLDPALAEHIARKRSYLSPGFFAVRSAVYVGMWAVIAALLGQWARSQRRDPDAARVARMRSLSGAAFPPVALTLTFAAFDWFMSLEPAWYSNAYGFYFFAGGFSAAIAAATLLAFFARRAGWLSEAFGESHFHACGRLLLASVCIWGYIAFSQFFIIWIADIPEEASWYLLRIRGTWRPVAIALVLVHFVVPFFALLQRAVTRRPARLAAMCAWVLGAHVLDLFWLTAPALARHGMHAWWLDLAALAFVGGLAFFVSAWRLRGDLAVPSRDPALQHALRYESR